MLSSGVTNVITHPAQMIARATGKQKESSKMLLGSFEDNAQFIDVTLNGAGITSASRRTGGTGKDLLQYQDKRIEKLGEKHHLETLCNTSLTHCLGNLLQYN